MLYTERYKTNSNDVLMSFYAHNTKTIISNFEAYRITSTSVTYPKLRKTDNIVIATIVYPFTCYDGYAYIPKTGILTGPSHSYVNERKYQIDSNTPELFVSYGSPVPAYGNYGVSTTYWRASKAKFVGVEEITNNKLQDRLIEKYNYINNLRSYPKLKEQLTELLLQKTKLEQQLS